MTIDWKQKASDYKEAYFKDLEELIAIPSVRDDEHSTDEYPLGEGPTKAMLKFLALGERDGFKVKNLDNIVGYIEYGSGDQTLAIQSHADVMPAGDGWKTDPFALTIKDEIAYGRGVSDDKGPGLAAYYGLRMLKDAGIEPKMKIRLIIGTDEESGWMGMKHYFEVEEEPTFGFSPDAEFPLINGEKGNSTYEIKFANTNDGDFVLREFNSGLRKNMVPGKAFAVVETDDNQALVDQFTAFLDEAPVTGSVDVDGRGVTLHVVGKQAHAQEPKDGINAGTYLAVFLNQFNFGNGAGAFISYIAEMLHNDSRGHAIKANFTDEIMGDLTMNVGIMTFDKDNGGVINTNFRYPKGMDDKDIQDRLEATSKDLNGTVEELDNMAPHYVDPSDPIVKTLLDVYAQQTGTVAPKPEVVGGGTYARLMKRGVAFGALFPETANTMHQANEFQPVADLVKVMGIYGQSIYELTK